jgi:uncharacterized membrane protein YphA (DoxX/SURF4 family)
MPIRVLRVCLGALFFASALLKLWSLHDPGFHRTAFWHLAGEHAVTAAALAAAEGLLGLLLAFGYVPRVAVVALALGVIVGTTFAAFSGDGKRSCGCLGTPRVEASVRISAPVRAAIVLLGLAACWPARRVAKATEPGGARSDEEPR